jgi:hypothetical protein
MATRRVKRIKRSKKHVHRARGRKTNHRRRRHTRRQTGGEIIDVCKRTGIGPFAKGIAITYDTVSKMYRIGNHDYNTLKTMDRYKMAINILDDRTPHSIGPNYSLVNGNITLSQDQFNTFRLAYCVFIGTPCCDKITAFKPPVAAAAPAPAAAAAPVAEVPKMSPNVLMINDSIIAYKNNKGVMRSVTVDRSNTDYEFDNFIIPINAQSDISGKLKVEFVGNPVVTRFTLELSMSSITPELIECVKGINDLVVHIENVSNSFSAMVITGTLTEQRVGEKKSTYDFSSFVLNFVKKYQDCLVAGQFVVSNPQIYINLITNHIAECSQRIDSAKFFSPEQKMSLKAVLTAFQQRFNDLKQTKDLEALKTLHEDVNRFRNVELFQAKNQAIKQASLAAQMKRLSVRGPGAGAAPSSGAIPPPPDFTAFGIDSDGDPIE